MGSKLLVLFLLFCCQRLVLPARQWFHLVTHRKPQPSSRDSIYSVSGLCFNIFYEFLAFIQDLTWLCELCDWTKKEKTYLSRNECVVGSSRVFTFPCAPNDYKYGGTSRLDNCELRCCSTSDVNDRLSCSTTSNGQKIIQHEALPNAEVTVLPHDKVNVVAVVLVVRLFTAYWKPFFCLWCL